MLKASAPWRRVRNYGTWDIEEVMMNSGREQVIDWIQLEEAKMLYGFAEALEEAFWGCPVVTDTLTMRGLFYYLVFSDDTATYNCATADDGDFAPYNPYGYSDCAGIDATTQANGRWANYSHQYVEVTDTDLIEKMQKGMFRTNFKPPMRIPVLHSGVDRAFYSKHSIVLEFGRKLKDQNDNLGPDVAWGEGKAIINGVPLFPVPYLDTAVIKDEDNNTITDPVVQIDWRGLEIHALKGNWMRRTKPTVSPTQSTVVVQRIYATCNLAGVNRRQLAIYAK